jgi:energy-coupling factor transporter ATP-binding protein EcfA2
MDDDDDDDDESEIDFRHIAQTVIRNSGLSDLPLSHLAARLMAESARCLKYKKSQQDELSSTTYALAAYLYSNERSDDTSSGEERGVREALALAGLNDAALNSIAEAFFLKLPEFPGSPSDYPTEKELSGVTFGPGTQTVLSQWRNSEPLHADVLLRMLLDNSGTGVFRRAKLFTDALDRTVSEETRTFSPTGQDDEGPAAEPDGPTAEPAAPAPPGRHVRIVREARVDELGLNVLDYAKALATILRVSEGEFSFALFGKWGSGKTTLLKLLKPLLEDPAEYRKNVSVPGNEKYADLGYKVVVHNAWKYRTPPEAWVYLYKSLATAVAASAGPLERWALALRSTTGRRGHGGLLLSLVLLAVALTPMGAKLQLTGLLVTVLGVSTFFYLAMIWMGAAKKVRQLFDRNLRLVGPDENLGMLALIGDDVRALLKAWTKDPVSSRATWKYPTWPLLGVAAVSLLWAIGLYLGPVVKIPAWISEIVKRLPATQDTADLVGVTHWTIWAVWTICAFGLMLLPAMVGARRPDKILLVVDDLDRCEPSEMLVVIENVRLLLDDDEINARLQVLMLVDESVLNHAIALRYETMINKRASSSDYEAEYAQSAAATDIVAEQIEKLFACHLRLSRLSDDDVVQLVQKLAGYENEQIRKKAGLAMATARRANEEELNKAARAEERAKQRYEKMSEQPPFDAHQETAAALLKAQAERKKLQAIRERLPKEADPIIPRPSDAPFEANDVRFSDDEIQILSGFVPSYFRTLRRRPSPRSIKALLFKLQLARLLMQLRYPDLPTEELRLEKLLQAFQREGLGTSDDIGPHVLIVRQVI